MDWLLQLDGNILLFIQEHMRMDWLTLPMTFITNLGNAGFIWLVLLAILLFIPKQRKTAIMGLIAIFIGFIITNVLLKNMVARIRPYEVVEGLKYIGQMPHDFSFPSGHSTCSIAAGAVLFCKWPKKAGIPVLIFAILICLSRLYVGVHYPTDVIAGGLVGLFGAFTAIKIVNFWEKKSHV